MTFFNQKENILELKLTDYGESLLSQGKFKPEYYSFSDDSVNYIFSSSGEGQNDIDGRIKLETPYLRVQKNRFSNSRDGKTTNIVGVDYETELAKKQSLGKCDTLVSSSSRLKVFVLDNEIESLSNFYTASATTTSRQDLAIPQIDINLEFTTAIDSVVSPTIKMEADPSLSDLEIFTDGGTAKVGFEQITLLIEEEGVATSFGDFEVEVFEIMEEAPNYLGDKPLRKLEFAKNFDDTYVDENNVYRPREDIVRQESLLNKYPPTTNDVGYYFDVFTDAYNEIPQSFICSLVGEIRRKDFALDASIDSLCPREDIDISVDDPNNINLATRICDD